jgi:hypothetical protein
LPVTGGVVEFQEEIREALVVRPGDKLLVRVHPATLPEDAKALLTTLRARFPETDVVVIAAEELAVARDHP